MSTALWIGIVIALLAGIIGVPLVLRESRKRDR
jgi:ABC-type Mn2+/Zn2+ transport system permease subunit